MGFFPVNEVVVVTVVELSAGLWGPAGSSWALGERIATVHRRERVVESAAAHAQPIQKVNSSQVGPAPASWPDASTTFDGHAARRVHVSCKAHAARRVHVSREAPALFR